MNTLEFEELVGQWSGFLRHIAHRYAMEAKDASDMADELYQEGLILLDRLVNDGCRDPDDPSFGKLFRTMVHNTIISLVRKNYTERRDWRREVRSLKPSEDPDLLEDLISTLPSSGPQPEELVSLKYLIESIDAIISDDPELLAVWHLLLHPDPLLEILESRNELNWQGGRNLNRIPLYMYSEYLGWPVAKVSSVLRELRGRVAYFLHTEGISIRGYNYA